MHFCIAMVAIANDDQQVVPRGPFNPVSWPEVEVLRTIHGDEAVREVKPFVHVEQTEKAEKERLGLIYGDVVHKQVWVGRNARMELDAAEMTLLDPGTPWLNPLSGKVETTPAIEEEIPIEDVDDAEEDEPGHRAKLSKLAKKRPRDEKGRLLPAESEDEVI